MDIQFTFKSAKKAYIIPVSGEVKGTIPNWIKGSLFRNGPGKYEFGPDKFKHAFDGMAMIQRFFINDGKVEFNSQYIQSKTYLKNLLANRIVVSEFGTVGYPDPCRSIFQKLSSYFTTESTDNTLVCVYPLGDELFTSTELDVIHRIDSTDLSTLGSVRLSSILAINRATAHFHIDSDSRLVHLIGFANLPHPAYAMVTIPPIKKEESVNMKDKYDMEKLLTNAKIVGKINVRWKWNPSYYHSFGLTEHYYILFECPLAINVFDLLRGKSAADAMKWWANEKTIIHIMDRKTGTVLRNMYVTDALFTFHHINAYEEQDHIIIDYCGYDDGLKIINSLKTSSGDGPELIGLYCYPKRLVVPLVVEKTTSRDENLVKLPGSSCVANIVDIQGEQIVVHCQQDLLIDSTMELPTINYNAYNAKKYRYVYGVLQNQVIKVDTVMKQSINWSHDVKGSTTCEAIFVPHPKADNNNPEDEDYGVLLVPVIIPDVNVDTERFLALVFVDAKSMKEIARAEFPSVSIPFSFHGYFQNL